ncbi:Uncharacterised protein [Serratia fonticola]|uniref:Uncharacterized protein n=1 Tax=Serratia fonticola TaxID=47917 RepID=A0A4U9V0X6_SERFO|nr:Uncharacterised protein [Serratia fonticola]VTR39293.1 Uncharacterised protein [Serratia fonticola]
MKSNKVLLLVVYKFIFSEYMTGFKKYFFIFGIVCTSLIPISFYYSP